MLIGASGTLGVELAAAFAGDHVVATHHAHPRAGTVFFDALATPVANLLAGRPGGRGCAVIMAGITAIDDCARDPLGSAAVNVAGVIRLIDETRALGLVPVFISSDGVFDGSRAWWAEGDQARPILEYGRQKLAVEQYLQASGEPSLVIRLPKLMEDRPQPRGFLFGCIQALGRPGPLPCAIDQYFTPASAGDAARAIATLARGGARGLYHVAGPERLSRSELMARMAAEYARHAPVKAQLADCRLGDLPMFEPRPLDTSMRCARLARDFGIVLRPAGDACADAVRAHFLQST
ncbi:MAG: sugar nucleotide-binding protein [Burkholderiales bacterium]|nr:sugar nucleotide-binding protein [Burkholderiales bacterium]